MRRAVVIVAGVLAAVAFSAAPAAADDTVVVHGLGFPSGGLTSLAITGCPGIFQRVAEPVATYLSNSPAVTGTRSLKYDLAGGNAVGSQHAVSSMTGTTVAGLSVQAPQGSSGVAYAGYRAPADWASSLVWIGRADLAAAPGGWQQVDATGLTYTWTHYDLATQQAVAASPVPPPASVRDFAAAHGGDGPGFYTLGFGCDGAPFKIDTLRVGSPGQVTTYDLEGFTSSAAISGSAGRVVAGDEVTLTGSVTDSRGRPVPQGLLVLEEQESGATTFVPVAGAAATVDASSATVAPRKRTLYRWRFTGTSSVDGSVSPTFTVEVATAVTAAPEQSADGVVVAGTAQPAGPGVSATLWRLTPAGREPAGATTVGADGTYRLELPEAKPARPAGRYVVTVPATGLNLAGESAVTELPGS